MPIENIIKTFNETYSDLTVTLIGDFDSKWFLIEAVEDASVIDYNDPYYLMSKDGATIFRFYPMMDFDKFGDAMDNAIYKYEG